MNFNTEFVNKLRISGLRPTKQRIKICEILFNREKTFSGQNTIKNWRNMAVREKKNILVFSIHVKWKFNFHNVIEQRNEELCTTKRSSRMTRVNFYICSLQLNC